MGKLFTIAVLFSFNNLLSQNSDVKEAFYKYKESILNQQGELAASMVNQKTLFYYDDVLEASKNGDSLSIENEGFFKKFMVLSVRHRLRAEELFSMTGKTLFEHGVNQGWIGKESVQGIETGTIEEDGKNAMVQMFQNGKEVPYFFQFEKENGQWQLDLTSIMETSEVALKEYLKENNLNENQFILQILEMVTGSAPDNAVWHPLKKN